MVIQYYPERYRVSYRYPIMAQFFHHTVKINLNNHGMRNPTFDRKHIKEYLLYGAIAAVLYIIPVLIFLSHHRYETLYYLYIGCALFMAAIFFYGYRLLYHRYDKKRAVSMLLASILATLTGIVISCLLSIVAMLFFFPDLFSRMPSDQIIPGAPASSMTGHPSELLLMILATATLGNFFVGSFISVIVAYAGKKDQTRDKPAHLETHIPAQKPNE